MKKFLIVVMLSIAAVVESSAQERIDALLNRDLYSKSGKRYATLRSAVKRDSDTGEVIKRVTELAVKDDKTLMKEFINAFMLECESAFTYQISEADGKQMLIWQDPLRIYTLSQTEDRFTVTRQIIDRPEENEFVKTKNE